MPGLDITPEVPAGRQLIQAYGDMRFRIAGQVHEGSVLVFPERARPWTIRDAADATFESLREIQDAGTAVEILVLGCGRRFLPPPQKLRADLKAIGIALEWMDTGAACRTFNVLLVEDRRAAAALIAVP